MLALVSIFVAGCADGDSDRRFANDPIPTEDILDQPPPAATRIVQPTASAATPMSASELTANLGTSSYTFVSVGNRIELVPVDGSAPATVLDLKTELLIAYAWSPNGERLAVLFASDDGTSLTIRNVDRTGATLGEVKVGSGASPIPAGFGLYRIVWSPLNDKLLLSLGTGGLLEITEDGTVRTILDAANAPSPRAIAWSPDGSSIAWVDAGTAGSATGLYLASIDALPVDPVTVIRPIEGRSRQIVEIAWGAAPAGIVYSERAPGGDLSIGGDLFSVSPSGGSPDLIATAGGVAQVGAIGTFAISPDGDTVVYSVIVPAGQGVAVRRLTLRQIDGPSSVDLPVEAGEIVEGFTWTTQGLVWTVRPAEDGAGHPIVQLALTDGSVKTLFANRDPATPIASPVSNATPVASPASSPTATVTVTS